MAGRPGRESWGALRKLASGRTSASYVGPDGRRHFAPLTFTTKTDARAWLARERSAIASGSWVAPQRRGPRPGAVALADVYARWLDDRARPLAATTRSLYRKLWQTHLRAQLGGRDVATLDADDVARWHRALDTGPTAKAHALGMLRAMLNYAAAKGLRTGGNPAAGLGPTTNRRVKDIEPATPAELAAIARGMRTQQGAALVLVAAWLALRWGEVTELRRGDVDLERGVVHVRRAVSRVDSRWVVAPPKAGSIRAVAIPPHIVPVLRDLLEHVGEYPDALLFPSPRDPARHLTAATFRAEFDPACAAAGLPGLTPHVLRHSGAVIAAQSGATLVDVMRRLGHTSTAAALRYQHSAEARQQSIAEAMSRMAGG